MYYLYFGSDETKVREAALAKASAAGGGSATVTKIDSENWQAGMLGDALGATSLFGEQEIFVIDTPSSDSTLQAEVEDALAAMAESDNIFVVIEGALLAAPKKKYQKYAADSEEFAAPKAERFNTFALADALTAKDKRKLWLLVQEAQHNGIAAEEIIGILWWQLKTLQLASKTKTASEAGMKDFPYNKAKRALGAFPSPYLEEISKKLLVAYHDGHDGTRDINNALEEWVLGL